MDPLEDTRQPAPEPEECPRCGCVPGVKTECDACPDKCACHWSKLDLDIMAADEELASRKEEV